MRATAISQQMGFTIKAPDWFAINLLPPDAAQTALKSILDRLQGIEEYTFAVRGWAFRMMKERELYRQDTSSDGYPFTSMNGWIDENYPKHKRYYKESLAAAENLPDIPFQDFADMPRCNIKQLEKVSTSVRTLPDVIEAAKTMPEREFVAKLNVEHSQHLDVHKPVLMASDGVPARFDKAIEVATLLWGCKSRGEAIEAIAEDFLLSHAEDFEREHTA